MAKAFFPTHDLDACAALSEVYEAMASAAAERLPADSNVGQDDAKVAAALRQTEREIREILDKRSSSTSASGVFLQAVGPSETSPLSHLLGEAGESARRAHSKWAEGRNLQIEGEKKPEAVSFGIDKKSPRKLFREALDDAERATSLNPLSTFAWETLGDIWAEFSDYEHARDAWKQALRTDPDNPHLYAKIGQSHWNIAFEGSGRAEPQVLRRALREFEAALLLYGNDDERERILTHQRLAKLCAALNRPAQARLHLQIVEAVDTPLVGWLTFALMSLQRGDFGEAEDYFGRVIDEGSALDTPLTTVIGDRLDERLWPLGLVRAWAHVGRVLSWIRREALDRPAASELDCAEELLHGVYGPAPLTDLTRHRRFPSRIGGTLQEARGQLLLAHQDGVDQAIVAFESSVSEYPYSRAYIALADALERKADNLDADEGVRRRAETLAEYARILSPDDALAAEATRVTDRLRQSANGHPKSGAASGDARRLVGLRSVLRRLSENASGSSRQPLGRGEAS
jgi:tetratricopeptide (TPR) repeat protein